MHKRKEEIIVYIDPAIKELIPEFLDNSREQASLMEKALEKKDFVTVKRIAHNFKGNGSGYGFDKITEKGREIESMVIGAEYEKISAKIKELKKYLEGVKYTV